MNVTPTSSFSGLGPLRVRLHNLTSPAPGGQEDKELKEDEPKKFRETFVSDARGSKDVLFMKTMLFAANTGREDLSMDKEPSDTKMKTDRDSEMTGEEEDSIPKSVSVHRSRSDDKTTGDRVPRHGKAKKYSVVVLPEESKDFFNICKNTIGESGGFCLKTNCCTEHPGKIASGLSPGKVVVTKVPRAIRFLSPTLPGTMVGNILLKHFIMNLAPLEKWYELFQQVKRLLLSDCN